jgi:hypothetical protein
MSLLLAHNLLQQKFLGNNSHQHRNIDIEVNIKNMC